jgi:fatty acid desaturase
VTDPASDPESRYLRHPASGGTRLELALAALQGPLIGRLVLGPPILIAGFLLAEARRAAQSPLTALKDWLPHLFGVLPLVVWLSRCRLSLPLYMAAIVYPGTALTLLRSFAEHRSDATPGHRIAIVESRGPLSLLFLNNNLHAAHHEAPGLPWYRLAAYHRDHRLRLLSDNGGLLYQGYAEVLRRYALRRHDALIHPDHAQSPAGA